MNIRVEPELRFNNAAHVRNHLKYLFRCDKAQKWTNHITSGNFAIYAESESNKGKIIFFNKTLNELSAQAQIINEKIKVKENFLEKGRMLRIELIDEATRFKEDDIKFGRMLYEAMVVSKNIEPICVVGHQDQEDYYLHWHLVYTNANEEEDFGEILMRGSK